MKQLIKNRLRVNYTFHPTEIELTDEFELSKDEIKTLIKNNQLVDYIRSQIPEPSLQYDVINDVLAWYQSQS